MQRYDSPVGYMDRCDEGEYVLLSDAQAALAERDKQIKGLKTEIATLMAEKTTLHEQIERLKEHLPEGMEHCKIIFEECPVGHGSLRGENWIKNDCPWCKITVLKTEALERHAKYAQTSEFLSKADEQIAAHRLTIEGLKDQITSLHEGIAALKTDYLSLALEIKLYLADATSRHRLGMAIDKALQAGKESE